MSTQWYYAKEGQQFGPVNDDQMTTIIGKGSLEFADLVWCEGMDDWVKAGDVFVALGDGQSLQAPPVQRNGSSASNEPGLPPPAGQNYQHLHPALALLLAVCTLGLFALWFIYQASRNFSGRVQLPPIDAKGRAIGQLRHPAWVLTLCCLTLGIYYVYWIYVTIGECAAFLGRREVSPRTELTLMLLFPPYILYAVVFRLSKLIRAAQDEAGIQTTPDMRHSYVFLNPCMFAGLPYLAMSYQDALNQLWLSLPLRRAKQT